MQDFISADEAVKLIKSNHRVFIQGGAATPNLLIDAMTHRHHEPENVEICHIHTEGEAP